MNINIFDKIKEIYNTIYLFETSQNKSSKKYHLVQMIHRIYKTNPDTKIRGI